MQTTGQKKAGQEKGVLGNNKVIKSDIIISYLLTDFFISDIFVLLNDKYIT